jgi:hypothetical protein
MTTLMERIAQERKRLRSVRQNMLAAIEQQAGGDDAYVAFYVAAAEYIDATMQRVHLQDVKMDAMIREKIEFLDESAEQALGELHERLEGAKEHLRPFLAARDALREQGAAALEAFEREGKVYSDFVVANMGHHPPTADLGVKLFSPEDWEYMAGATDEEMERDQALFEQFTSAIPENLAAPQN